jgi:hypothetical protein
MISRISGQSEQAREILKRSARRVEWKGKTKIHDSVGKVSLKEGTKETQAATRELALVLWRHLKNAKRHCLHRDDSDNKAVATDCGESCGDGEERER